MIGEGWSAPALVEEGGERHEVRRVRGKNLVVGYGVSAEAQSVEGDPVGGVAGVHGRHHAGEQTVLGLPQSDNIKYNSSTTRLPVVSYLAVTRLPIVSCIGMSSGKSL